MTISKSAPDRSLRLPEISRGPAFQIDIDGTLVDAYPGETVAAVMAACGIKTYYQAPDGSPRGYTCGIGRCFGCLVTINGINNVRACQTLSQPGMRIRTGALEVSE